MLRISRLADYGTVIMNYLASQPQCLQSANELAKKAHVSLPTASKILKILVTANLVASVKGTRGGYRLARDPQSITLADVITALDGQPAITECNVPTKPCSKDAFCAIRDNWRIINKVIMTALQSVTLTDMTSSLDFHPLVLEGIKPQWGSCRNV